MSGMQGPGAAVVQSPWSGERGTSGAARGAAAVAGAVGVLGARGGAGSSTLAALLALTFARTDLTALVQVGRGPALDAVLGTEHNTGLRWPDLAEARGVVDPEQLAGVLPRWRRCRVLSPDDTRPGPIPAGVETDVLRALRQGHCTVVVDLDRAAVGGGASPALEQCDRVVLLVPRDIPAVAGARALLCRLPPGARVGVVTRRPSPGGLGGPEIAAALDRSWWGELPGGRAVARAVDAGVGPVAGPALRRRLRRLARLLG